MGSPFRNKVMHELYTGCIAAASNNWSEMYLARTTAGFNPTGPNAPRTGAAHRVAFWQGYRNQPSLYSRDRKIVGYAAWRAGQDFRVLTTTEPSA